MPKVIGSFVEEAEQENDQTWKADGGAERGAVAKAEVKISMAYSRDNQC